MIQIGELIKVGQILKPHGLKGEIMFGLITNSIPVENDFFIFLLLDGIPVPFYVNSVRMISDQTGLTMLDGIDTEENAREFAGAEMYMHREQLNDANNDEMAVDNLIGYTLVEEQAGEVGIISSIDTTTENTLFVIKLADDELLIPLAEEYILGIDQEKKIIAMSLPEGLLSL